MHEEGGMGDEYEEKSGNGKNALTNFKCFLPLSVSCIS
jgi:hypothetical protein